MAIIQIHTPMFIFGQMSGNITTAEWDEWVDGLGQFWATCEPGCFMFEVLYNASVPNGPMRRKLAETMNKASEEQLSQIAAQALLVNSAPMRGAITAVNWITSRPYPQRVFGTSKDAIDWIGKRVEQKHVQEMLKQMKEVLPADQAYPGLLDLAG